MLAALRDALDPETGERYTVKRYASEKTQGEDRWRHLRVTLEPENPDFEPIVLGPEEAQQLDVVAEFLEVIR